MTSVRGLQTTLPVQSSRDAATGASWRLEWVFPTRAQTAVDGLPLTLGRAEMCSAALHGVHISRQHARIVESGPILVAEDLASRNGTYVDGVRCERAPLGHGSVLRVGEWVGVLLRSQDMPSGTGFGELAPGMVGGPKLSRALELARRAAPSDLPIVVEGETGTGKECAARAVHSWSARRGPFVGVNCAALPESLAEGELFGFRKGAFTGANENRLGHFRAAHTGTLLLDEFADLPLTVQAKLLRVIEQREVLPLGESRPVPVDVRLIVTAQEPLSDVVAHKRLRPDLYARLSGLTVRLPPLRDCVEDTCDLFRYFIGDFSGGHPPALEAELVERLCLYSWPFNVRELKLLAKRLLILAGHEPVLRRSHLPNPIQSAERESPSPVCVPIDAASPERPTREQQDERDLAALLVEFRAHKGNLAQACAAVGLSRARAYRLLQRSPEVDLRALREEPVR